MTALTSEEIIEVWRRQLQRLTAELNHLAHVDDVFWQVQAIIAANPDVNVGDVFQHWIGTCYVSTIVTGLRRIVDKRSGALSLLKLLDQMGDRSTDILTRERFVGGWERDLITRAHRSFDGLGGRSSAGEVLHHIPRSAIDLR